MRSWCRKIFLRLQSLILQEGGQDLVEYSLIILFVVVALVATVGSFSSALVSKFAYINSKFP
jgi:Flp pilus assembly pilin Flp